MPVDRLTQIRHNWQEKGNGPRGRDVDFLLGLVDAPAYGPEGRWAELREKADEAGLYREALKDCAIAANNGIVQHESRKRGAVEKLRYIFKRSSAALLPATESAAICEECGSGLLNGEHIADYPCSRRATESAQPEEER